MCAGKALFSVKKITYNAATGTVIYKSKKTPRKSKGGRKNFQIFTAAEFIAAITQHIPEKSFQLVRHYGWCSNRGRGERGKCYQAATANPPDIPATVDVLDASVYRPRKVVCIRSCRRLTPSPQWRECIKNVWEVDPLACTKCGSEMKIISFITEAEVIRKILEHLNLWDEEQRIRPPPSKPHLYPNRIYEPFDDG